MNNVLKISLLTLLIIISRFVLQVDYNEMDVLPSAYSVYNPNWLFDDWYLSLNVSYRALFGYIIGFFIDLAGFIPVLLIGRIFTYVLLSYAYLKLIQCIKINFLIGSVVLMLFLTLLPDGAFYGEWMVGGLETKVFSYVFVLLSISAYLKEKLKESLLFAGLAFSFHLLIGGYYAVCLIMIFLTQKRSEISYLFANSYWYLVGGILGFYGIYHHLINAVDSNTGWEIYTQLRVAYHVIPKFSLAAIAFPLLIVVFNLAILKYTKKEKLKSLSIIALTTSAISVIGYLFYFIGETAMLRFYFFRLNDGLTQLLTLLILGFYVSDNQVIKRSIESRKKAFLAFSISLIAFALHHIDNVRMIVSPSNYSEESILDRSAMDLEMTSWIKKNTPKESVFIVPMAMSNFYMEAERAMFVSWKHLPQSGAEIEEWHRRLLLLNRGYDLEMGTSFFPQHLEENYSKLSKEELTEIKTMYPKLTHIILPAESNLELNIVFETNQFKLMQLE